MGIDRFYGFTCTRRTALISCSTQLGDAMRYKPNAKNMPVVLGKKHVVQYGIGWGTAHPRVIFNGGDPSGGARHLKWRSWGAPIAYARGIATIQHPGGNFYPKPGVIELRASHIGRCTPHGPRAYTHLDAREAVRPGGPLSGWGAWSSWKSICHAPGG